MAETFQRDGKLFVKSFLLDDTLNLNRWGVTKDAIINNLNSFIGKPFVITPKFGHPEADTGDDLMQVQEEFRVGNIIEVGYETDTGKAFAVSEITDEKAAEMLSRGEPMFVSPSIVFGDSDMMVDPGTQSTVVTRFEGAHLAAVKDPAYGMQKAQIKGKCRGGTVDCKTQLAKVQATIEYPFVTHSPCGNYTKVETRDRIFVTAASECMSGCLSKKKDEGVPIDDQAIAICLSECGESRDSVMDPESVENITTVPQPCETSSHKPCPNDKQSMSNTKRAQEDEEKKEDEEAQEEPEEEKKEEDANTDENLKKVKEEMANMEEELKELKSRMKKANLEPLVNDVIEAKMKLGRIQKQADRDKEFEKLMSYEPDILTQLKAEYETMAEIQNKPRYSIKYASFDNDPDGEKIFLDKKMEELR